MNKQKAIRRLSFYFRTLYEGLGWEWERDNQSEIEELVDWMMGGEEREGAGRSYAEHYHGYRRMRE